MKKFLTAVLALVLTLAVGTSAFAAGSAAEASAELVNGASGEKLAVSESSNPITTSSDAVKTALAQVNAQPEDAAVIYSQDIKLQDSNGADITGTPVTITFKNLEAYNGKTILAFLDGQYVDKQVCANGQVTYTFPHLTPVALVVVGNTNAPVTGDSLNFISYLAVAVAAAGVGSFAYSRKKKLAK